MGLRDFDLDAALDDWTEYYLGNGPSLVVFLVLNAAAFLVGVSFYVHSDPALSDLPTFLYPLFGDSPTALALMTLSAATLLPNLGRRVADAPVNRPLAYLHTLAFVWLVKYGLWTAFTLNYFFNAYYPAVWSYWGILFTHLVMVAEAFLIPYYGRTSRFALGVTACWFVANDVADYAFDLHPHLQTGTTGPLPWVTPLLSLGALALAWYCLDGGRDDPTTF